MRRRRSKLGKIVTFVVFTVLGYQYQDIALKHAQVLYDVYPLMQTYLEMTSYSSRLNSYISENGEMPFDLPEWLNQNFTVKTGKEPGVDYFDTPYEGSEDEEDYVLRSCGRDTYCETEDDLKVALLRIEDESDF